MVANVKFFCPTLVYVFLINSIILENTKYQEQVYSTFQRVQCMGVELSPSGE